MSDGPVSPFRTAQRNSNATDMILDDLDRSAIAESYHKTHELLVQPNIIVQTFKLKGTDIIGLALYKNSANSASVRIQEIKSTDESDDLIQDDNFVAAVYLPKVLREQVLSILPDPVVVVTVFLNDKLFSETSATPPTTSGAVFGVLIPEFRDVFQAPVKVVYKVRDRETEHKRCAHWLYGSRQKGAWETEKVATFCGGVEVCEYYHVTHFGLLITGAEDSDRVHQPALDIITLVGSILSLIGIGGILLTAAIFPQWRANRGNVVLTNYALATLLEIVLLYASGHAKENAVCDLTWCFVTGILLHYVVLAQFFWVLVISFLQYKRYVEIFGDVTTNLVAKACLVGWATPLIIVVPVGTIYTDNYTNAYSSICYPDGLALFIGVLLPILLIVIVNLAIFGMIAKNLFANPKVRSTRAGSQTLLKFRLLVLLFFQLGISWVFGFLGKLHISLVYIFCLTATLQGFFVFLLFIIFNQPTRLMYVKLVRPSAGATKPYSTRETTNTSTTGDTETRPSVEH